MNTYLIVKTLHIISATLMVGTGFGTAFYASSALDVFFGILCFTKFRNYRFLWLAQFAVVLGYSVIVACRLPEMWLHPFAPLVKNVPILAALWVLGSRHERADVPAAQ